jgi:hypothetical protein
MIAQIKLLLSLFLAISLTTSIWFNPSKLYADCPSYINNCDDDEFDYVTPYSNCENYLTIPGSCSFVREAIVISIALICGTVAGMIAGNVAGKRAADKQCHHHHHHCKHHGHHCIKLKKQIQIHENDMITQKTLTFTMRNHPTLVQPDESWSAFLVKPDQSTVLIGHFQNGTESEANIALDSAQEGAYSILIRSTMPLKQSDFPGVLSIIDTHTGSSSISMNDFLFEKNEAILYYNYTQ